MVPAETLADPPIKARAESTAAGNTVFEIFAFI
jgi:hypothetical protein